MQADVSLCPHLAGDQPAFSLAPDEIVLWHDGPVEAIARCADCGAPGWLELVDWSPHGVRIYALAGLRGNDVALYLHDARKGSCDLTRQRAEAEALAASAGRFERLVAWQVDEARLLASAALREDERLPSGPWRERLPAAAELRWFARLGLEKTLGA